MSYLVSNIPHFDAWVRKEYTHNHIKYHGEYLQAPPEDLIVEEVWQEEETFYISLKGVDDD